MNILHDSYLIMSGLCAYVALQHAFIALRRPDLKAQWPFAFLAAVMFAHTGLLAWRSESYDLVNSLYLGWSQWSLEILLVPAMILFVQRFTAGKGKVFLPFVLAVAGLVGCIHFWSFPQSFSNSGPVSVREVDLGWLGSYYKTAAPKNFWYFLFIGTVATAMFWGKYRCVAAWQETRSRNHLVLLAALLVIDIAILNSVVMLDLLQANMPQIIDHSFIALILVMSLAMNEEIVHAGTLSKALKEHQAQLSAAFDAIVDGVLMCDANGQVHRANPSAEKLLSLSDPRSSNLNISTVIPISDKNGGNMVGNIVTRLASGEQVTMDEPQEIRSGIWVTFAGAPIVGADQEILGMVFIIRDVSEQRRLHSQLAQGRRMESLGQLAGGVAHDFNNMLASIIGANELLEYSITTGSLKTATQSLGIINRSADRASDLTKQLLTFSRRKKAPEESVNLHQVLEESITLFKSGATIGIDIRVTPNAHWDLVMGDRSLLINAFVNLMVNAKDAMPDGGTITIETVNVASDIMIRISDTGAGMAQEVVERIFDPFFTTKGPGAGTGLGLSTVYGTITNMQGTITCESRLNLGTTFTINLPATEPTTGTKAIREGRVDLITGLHILVVDDEDDVREVLCATLRHLEHLPKAASSGTQALEILSDDPIIDLVILDMMMPGMNGAQTLRAIREIHPELPVIISSGFIGETRIEELTAHGRVSFLNKPYNRQTLAEQLTRSTRSSIAPKHLD